MIKHSPISTAHLDINSNVPMASRREVMTSYDRDVRTDYQATVTAPSIAYKPDDDLFGDIDIDFALYDFDLLSPMSPKLPPLSPDELVHVFPSSATSDGYSSHVVGYNGGANSGSCKTDVICDDLDHIMQVLVGM